MSPNCDDCPKVMLKLAIYGIILWCVWLSLTGIANSREDAQSHAQSKTNITNLTKNMDRVIGALKEQTLALNEMSKKVEVLIAKEK